MGQCSSAYRRKFQLILLCQRNLWYNRVICGRAITHQTIHEHHAHQLSCRRNTNARFRCPFYACISLNFHFSFICLVRWWLNGWAVLRPNKFFEIDCSARPSLFNAHVVYGVKFSCDRVCVFCVVSTVLNASPCRVQSTTQQLCSRFR